MLKYATMQENPPQGTKNEAKERRTKPSNITPQ